MEYMDVVDENNELTGEVEDKDIIHEKGLWHREVVIWVMNENGEILVQKRAATKKIKPNKWGFCAGHVDASEDAEAAAKRELFEEVGLICDLEFLFIEKVPTKRANNNIEDNKFMYMFFAKTSKKPEDFNIQYDELSEVKYISMNELERAFREKDENYTSMKRDYMPRIIEELKKRKDK